MENTFTYTARSALAPEKVVTFTLHDHHMSVDLGAPVGQIERALADTQEESGAEPDVEERAQSTYALKPTAVSLLERGTHPFNLADVHAQAEDGGLTITAWVRTKGLRLTPIRFSWEQVDNPEGAKAFANQVSARREAASHPGRFKGPMDYWISWLLAGVLALFLLWPHGGRDNRETEQA